MSNANIHTAWRFNIAGQCLYVQEIRKSGERGDRYNYTDRADKALSMTEAQCRTFTRYMKECDSVGFWS